MSAAKKSPVAAAGLPLIVERTFAWLGFNRRLSILGRLRQNSFGDRSLENAHERISIRAV